MLVVRAAWVVKTLLGDILPHRFVSSVTAWLGKNKNKKTKKITVVAAWLGAVAWPVSVEL